MALERYRQKRDFRVTPEPAGKVGSSKTRKLGYVIQKHAATRLHFDFRLELDGVLLSWAVPKGPSLDPNDKRLAMHVEDHPLEYGEFEGVIPPKQYGAGTVMVWDRGTWTPKGDAHEGYRKGHLKFELDGQKLHGTWNLVKSRSAKYGGDSWLLFKEADDYARLGLDGLVDEDQPDSVLTGRSMDEIRAQADRVWQSNRSAGANVKEGAIARRGGIQRRSFAGLKGAAEAPMPERIQPQLATLVRTPPAAGRWLHEVKYDGYRMLARISGGEVRLISRTGKDWTEAFTAVAQSLARLPVKSAWVDGEVVVLDENGRTSFQALQNAIDNRNGRLTYFAFDLLYLDGVDLRGVVLEARKALLARLLEGMPGSIRYSEHFEVAGADFLANVTSLGLEGMVSKRADLPMQAGRSTAWTKVKCARRERFTIGGFTDPGGSRVGFGALLLAQPHPEGGWVYCGRVGTGFSDATLAEVHRRLLPLEQSKPPFSNPPTGVMARGVHWVKPALDCEVSFVEWTDDRTLRHPTFVKLVEPEGSRKPAARAAATAGRATRVDVKKSASSSASSPAPRTPPSAKGKDVVAGIALSNADKLLYADVKLSKRDLADYYVAVAQRMLPHVQGRPLSLVRCPNGWDQKCFYQKHADDSVPAALTRIRVPDGSTYLCANSVEALVALVQMGVLEVHPWGSREGKLRQPDRIIFDLDPDEDLPWSDVKQAVQVVKALIENLGMTPFLKSTGGKGLHVVVPLEPGPTWDTVKGFTKAVAELLERTFPDRFTSKLLKVSRGGRIFVDYLRNAEGATAVAAYSLRAKAGAPVSVPLAWNELTRDVRFAHFHARNVPARIARQKVDPWAGITKTARLLDAATMARVGFKAVR